MNLSHLGVSDFDLFTHIISYQSRSHPHPLKSSNNENITSLNLGTIISHHPNPSEILRKSLQILHFHRDFMGLMSTVLSSLAPNSGVSPAALPLTPLGSAAVAAAVGRPRQRGRHRPWPMWQWFNVDCRD